MFSLSLSPAPLKEKGNNYSLSRIYQSNTCNMSAPDYHQLEKQNVKRRDKEMKDAQNS